MAAMAICFVFKQWFSVFSSSMSLSCLRPDMKCILQMLFLSVQSTVTAVANDYKLFAGCNLWIIKCCKNFGKLGMDEVAKMMSC